MNSSGNKFKRSTISFEQICQIKNRNSIFAKYKCDNKDRRISVPAGKPQYGLRSSIITAVIKKYITLKPNTNYLDKKFRKLHGELTERDFNISKTGKKVKLFESTRLIPDEECEIIPKFEVNGSYFANPMFNSRFNSPIKAPRRFYNHNQSMGVTPRQKAMILSLRRKNQTSMEEYNNNIKDHNWVNQLDVEVIQSDEQAVQAIRQQEDLDSSTKIEQSEVANNPLNTPAKLLSVSVVPKFVENRVVNHWTPKKLAPQRLESNNFSTEYQTKDYSNINCSPPLAKRLIENEKNRTTFTASNYSSIEDEVHRKVENRKNNSIRVDSNRISSNYTKYEPSSL